MPDSPVTLNDLTSDTVDQAPHNEWAKAEVVVGPEGGTLSTGTLEAPLELSDDWRGVLIGFGLDPDIFEVVDDTVRMGKWQTSKGLEDGTRSTIWLYSYKARFRRRPIQLDTLDIDAIRERIAKWKPRSQNRFYTGTDLPSTFVICWADWQLGKSAGGGVEATVARIEESFDLCARRIAELRKIGRNIERVAVLNMGDPTESCDGQYASQLFSIELTQREQLNLCLDLWIAGVKSLQPDFFGSALCNHGEWTRRGAGTRPVTTDSDNVSGYLADTLRKVFDATDSGPTEWAIPHDEMVQMVDFSGVNVAFTHGHKIPTSARELEYLRGQSIKLMRDEGIEPRLWVTAHRHHVNVTDFGPWWRLQCPSLDGGSKWYADTTGNWATAGTLTFLVGQHDIRNWSDMAVLGTQSAT